MFAQEIIRKEALQRNLSPRTIETYCFCVDKFLRFCCKELKYVTRRDIEEYLSRLVLWNKSSNTLNVHLNALKFLFEQCLKKRLTLKISFSKVPRTLPEFLTKEETAALLRSISNPKHRLMLQMLYGTGMRVSELLHLKVKDLDFNQNYGWVRQGKGRKDRLFVLPLHLKECLAEHIRTENLNRDSYLFVNSWKRPYSASSLRLILSRAAKQAGLVKNLHLHTLRHSFATHLIQNGYSVTEVQPLMGHNSINTTMIYLHLASPNLLNVQSPLDSLPEKIN
ncbi:tyrosine-type recombinase/integrase [Candidatus Woesearchaeota archaeon]|nr:tyrosine-type recombinase/integrase [Candidatus Woesearchaeota archaeon]